MPVQLPAAPTARTLRVRLPRGARTTLARIWPWQAAAVLRRSLRARLALWYSALLMVVLLLFGITVYVLTANAIVDGVIATVRAEARVAATDLDRSLSSTSPYWPAHLSLASVDNLTDPDVTVRVVDLQNRRRYSSTSVNLHVVPLPPRVLAAAQAGQPSSYTIRVSGERLQVEVFPVRAPASGTGAEPGPIIGVLAVAKSLHDADAALASLRTLLIIGGLVALSVALSGGWAIATRMMRPLAEVAETAGTIAASATTGLHVGSLAQRVHRPRGEDEVAHLVDTFNTMLTALERATAAQQRFVADASHELRVPLTTIQGNLALLLDHGKEIAEDERREMLADAKEETLRLVRLVNELLVLARSDARGERALVAAGPADSQAQPLGNRPRPLVDLDHVVVDVVRQTRARLEAEKSPLSLRITHVEPVRIRGDEQQMRQLTLILLDNAVKYTPPERAGASVTVSLRRQYGQALLRVRDTGIGIDAADLPHLFERFYRADRARDRNGTGLGLAIASTLAQQHGGTITVESTPGRGSTFSVMLPAPPIA